MNNKTREMTTPTAHPFLFVCTVCKVEWQYLSDAARKQKNLIISGLLTVSTRLSHLPYKDLVNLLSRSENGWALPLQVS